jgi:hypothetical protein
MECEYTHIYISDSEDISTDATVAYNLISQGKFLDGLRYIGYAIASIISDDVDEDHNCTDCITTSKALVKLFAPVTKTYTLVSGQNSDKLQSILLHSNFIDVKVSGLEYHRFVLIKIDDTWYLCGSFSEKYTLRIVPVHAYHLLTNMNANTYNLVFDSSINKSGYATLSLSVGTYSSNYRERLLLYLSKRMTPSSNKI